MANATASNFASQSQIHDEPINGFELISQTNTIKWRGSSNEG